MNNTFSTIEEIVSYLWDTQMYTEDLVDLRQIAQDVWDRAPHNDITSDDVDAILDEMNCIWKSKYLPNHNYSHDYLQTTSNWTQQINWGTT